MKMQIKNYITNDIIFEGRYISLRLALEKNKFILEGAYLRGADLRSADLEGANLRGAYLRGADLRSADLEGANLRGAYLRGAYLEGADLEGADLRSADLEGANLRGANLRGAYLEGAYLRGAYLRGAYLEGAYLRGADLEDKIYLNIKGSKHELYCIGNQIQIGCIVQPIEKWECNYKEKGKNNDYTEKEIEEYYNYIQICKKLNMKV